VYREDEVDWGRFAQQMASMARDLLAQESVDATLARITASATELVEGCDVAGILVLHEARVETLAPTDQLVIDNDQLQQRLGEGPCFDAARSSQGERVFRIADLTGEQQRWPAYAPQAQALGVGSMMGFLLFTDDEDLGELNLYSRKPGAFTEASELAGWLLASHAAVAPAPAPRWNRP
jgi:transcriptional regulator with GAF, ATPase, and Fis domain